MGPFVLPALNLGLSLAGQAANAMPDKYQKFQKKRIGELEGDLAAGRGLSSAEASTMSNTGMAPVRAMTGSMASELARLQAGGGGVGGGAAQAAARNQIASTLGQAAERIGYRTAAANQEALGAKRQELEDRMAAQSQRRADIVGGLQTTIGQGLDLAGEMLGAVPGTYRLSGDIEAIRRDNRAARETPPGERVMPDGRMAEQARGIGGTPPQDPIEMRRMDVAMFMQRNPTLRSALAQTFAANPMLQRKFTELIDQGVPVKQALTMLGV
jgi:hypothetical protein